MHRFYANSQCSRIMFSSTTQLTPYLLLPLILIFLRLDVFVVVAAEYLEPERIQFTSVKPGSTLALVCTIIRPEAEDADTTGADTDFMNYVWRREFGTTRREEIFMGNIRQTSERWQGSKYELRAAEGVYDLIINEVAFEDAGEYRLVGVC